MWNDDRHDRPKPKKPMRKRSRTQRTKCCQEHTSTGGVSSKDGPSHRRSKVRGYEQARHEALRFHTARNLNFERPHWHDPALTHEQHAGHVGEASGECSGRCVLWSRNVVKKKCVEEKRREEVSKEVVMTSHGGWCWGHIKTWWHDMMLYVVVVVDDDVTLWCSSRKRWLMSMWNWKTG